MKTIFVLTFFSISAFAGGSVVGNGGGAVVCRDAQGKIKSAQVLDYYEGEKLRGIKASLGSPKLSYQKKVELALNRLQSMSPTRARAYKEQFKNFSYESALVKNVQFTEIEDAAFLFFPKGCQVEQVAIQKIPIFPEDKRFYIQEEIWNAMNNDHKAGLVLHEIIYREALKYGHVNSTRARYFNSWISSATFQDLTFLKFVQILNFSDLPQIDIDGFQFEFASCLGSNDSRNFLLERIIPCSANSNTSEDIFFSHLVFDHNGELDRVKVTFPATYTRNNEESYYCKEGDYIQFNKQRKVIKNMCVFR